MGPIGIAFGRHADAIAVDARLVAPITPVDMHALGGAISMAEHPALRALEPDEEIHVQAQAGESVVVVTDRRLAVASQERLALDVPIDNLRRVQFDIERDRPATLVVVPQRPLDEPQVLAVRPAEYEAVAQALVVIGRRLAAQN
jgi:hypothetical protein